MKIKTGKLLKRLESAGHYVEVRENRTYRWMCFDDDVFQTLINKKCLYESTLGHMPVLLKAFELVKNPKKALIMGLGGGALIHSINYFYPNVSLTAVEINEMVIQLAKEYFYLDDKNETLKIIHADIRDYLQQKALKHDLIFVDLYQQGEMPGFYLEKSFHQNIFKHLKKSGLAVYNLLCDDQEQFLKIANTIRDVFNSQTLCIPVDDFDNIILYAFHAETFKNKIYQLESQRSLTHLQYQMEIGLTAEIG